jgi:uncharacterized membrane protein YeaQ/YmgE (transglycosylase-associated protein family)
MENISWFASIILGGFAGWFAGKLMDMRFNVFLNIIIGMVGSVIAVSIFQAADFAIEHNRMGYFVTAFLGAVILLFVAKLVRR